MPDPRRCRCINTAEVVRRQKLQENWLNPESLKHAFKHLVVEQDILAQIGPAVNSNKSFLIYGQPGNGKTALAESLFRVETRADLSALRDRMPGQHHPALRSDLSPEDRRRSSTSSRRDPDASCPTTAAGSSAKRPFIITGGELTLDMLDLSYNKVSKVYDAPFQLKANNGIYLIDDFGRQKASPGGNPEPLDRAHGTAHRLSELPGGRQDDGAV